MDGSARASTADHWLSIVRRTPLGILCDLDGTLVPFACTPDQARPDRTTIELVSAIAAQPGVTMAIVSGRPKAWLEDFFAMPQVLLAAEHGAARRGDGAHWIDVGAIDTDPLEELATALAQLVERHPGALLERKQTTVALHWRNVRREQRGELLIEAYGLIDAFVARHPGFGRHEGVLVTEVRPVSIRKSSAVPWIRHVAGAGARLVALGDDLTDEHMFLALGPTDESIIVRTADRRRTAARWELDDAGEVRAFLRWLHGIRAEQAPAPMVLPRAVEQPVQRSVSAKSDLLVVSNRLPELRPEGGGEGERRRNVGGLISALQPALQRRRGMWLGWSGRTVPDSERTTTGWSDESRDPSGVQLAGVDYTQSWYRDYYSGFCNGALWPLFHSFPSRVAISDAGWSAYNEVHETFGDFATRLMASDATIWTHDYHLLLFARVMRQRGHTGPMGHFLHVPFPAVEIFAMLPWAAQIIDAMLAFDLLGFHTPQYVANFVSSAASLLGARISDDVIQHRGRATHVAAMPIGIVPDAFQERSPPTATSEIEGLVRVLGDAKLVLGVDRLDYTKGIPERLLAFGRMLDMFPEWRRKVSLVQVSVPSRADVPLYAEQRARIEAIVGRLNGEYGEAAWVPVRYLYRSYGRQQLTQLYRAATVGYVTPLRDGMNLVAKEYVAAQDPEDPGVLLLSRFAGAAIEMHDAVLTNPYHVDGMARDLDRALRMPLGERRERHAKLLATVRRSNAVTWAEGFLDALAACR